MSPEQLVEAFNEYLKNGQAYSMDPAEDGCYKVKQVSLVHGKIRIDTDEDYYNHRPEDIYDFDIVCECCREFPENCKCDKNGCSECGESFSICECEPAEEDEENFEEDD